MATTTGVNQFGKYDILGEVSRGGVGIIYRARQRGLERIVALKVLQGGTMASKDQVARFLTEAQSAAKLQHPNIVPIHDFGALEGQHFFTMDFIEGKSLADVVAKGSLPTREALEIVRQTAEALHYAHEHGVVHRDIKPGNILLDEAGRVKVTDFGIAKELDKKAMSLTMEGQVMGTPRYMSPEQASGKTALADGRSDVFSLGATFYEMLTGQPAFDAETVLGVLQKVVTAEPPPPHKLNPKVHRDVSTICLKALEKSPDRRYQTALEMAEDIQRFIDGEPIEARPVGPVERAGRQVRRHWKAIALNAGLVAFAVYVVLFYLNARPGHLRIQLQPRPVNVALDGEALSEEDAERGLEVKAGKHTLRVELEPTYDPQEIALELKPGEHRTVPVMLARRKGRLLVTTDPPDAAITVVGPDKFHAPLRGPRIEQELPTGPYSVLVHQENFLARRVEVAIQNRQTNTLHFALPPVTLWSVPTSGNAMSVPVVADMDGDGWGDVVAGDDDGKIYCLSGKNGVALWVFRAKDAVQAPLALADVNRDGVPDVVVGSTDSWLYCVNGRNGQLLWSRETRGPIVGPALIRDVAGALSVFVGSTDGTLYCVGGADGQLAWKFPTGGRIENCVAWCRETLLVGSADKTLSCLNPRTGELLWKVDAGQPLLLPPRIENDTALLPTPKTAGDARTITAVSLTERKVVGVDDSFPRWVDLAGNGQPVKVVVTDKGTTVFGPDGTSLLWSCDYQAVSFYAADVNGDGWLDLVFNNGPDELLCLSGHNGAVLGRIKLDAAVGRGYALDDVDRDGVPDVVVGAGRKLYCFSWVGGRRQWLAKSDSYFDTPAVNADGKIIIKNQAGDIVAYDPARSEPLWKLATAAQPSPYAGVATGQGLVVDADAKTRLLRAIAANTGNVLWQARLTGEADAPIGAAAVANGVVVVGDGVTGLHCLSATNGQSRWSAAVAKVTAAPAIGRDAVVVADGENGLHCLALADGKPRWRFRSPTADSFPSAPALLDLNGDGAEDAVAVNDNGFTYALDGRTGKLLWQMEHSPARARSRHRLVWTNVNGTPFGAVANAKGDVFWIHLTKGLPVWTTALREGVLGEPVLADMNSDGIPDVVVGTMARRVHCLSGKDGAELWSYEVGAQIRFGAPLLVKTAGGATPLVFIGTGPPENALYCLRGDCVRTSHRAWLSPWPR